MSGSNSVPRPRHTASPIRMASTARVKAAPVRSVPIASMCSSSSSSLIEGARPHETKIELPENELSSSRLLARLRPAERAKTTKEMLLFRMRCKPLSSRCVEKSKGPSAL